MDEQQLMQAFAKMLRNEVEKHDLPSGFTLTTNFMHGVNGVFGGAGISQDIFSTRIKPRGILGMLPAFGARDTHPLVGFLTGFTTGDGSASYQDAPCDDPPTAGNIKSCKIGSAFGRFMAATDPLQMDRIGEIINRGEFTDLRVVNDPILDSSLIVPNAMSPSATRAIRQEVLARFLALGAYFEQVLCPMVWEGDTSNNSDNDGYQEFMGFQNLVKTGHTDVTTGASCPSLDADVKDANYTKVEDNAAWIFHLMTTMYRYVLFNAQRMGFMPVNWAWVMPDSLFRTLTDYWPCVYASYRCNATDNDLSNSTDALQMRQMSDQMYTGHYLLIDGVRVPVVTDDCMPIDTNTTDANVPNPCMASDIYLIPFTVQGGRPVTYFEYFDFNGPNGVSEAVAAGWASSDIMVADGGRFLITKSRTYTCMQWEALIKLRLRLLTPMLSGRIQNVLYCPLQMTRQPFPDQNYFVDGGNETRTYNSPYYSDRQ
jgi:hypothetical protein